MSSFCQAASIDIAGFDLMFPDAGDPVFIEINFHFGCKGLGGNQGQRRFMNQAAADWRQDRIEAIHEGQP